LTQIGQRFGLSDKPGSGVSCSENGLFVGEVPILELTIGTNGSAQWQPRRMSDVNCDLSKRYGLPVELNAKTGELTAIARALGRGDLLCAQITTLHLRIPDPPPPTRSTQTASEIIDLARHLQASSLLKADWDPTKHPRWPAGSPGGVGGEFAPGGTATGGSAPKNPNARVIPAQLTIPAPFDFPIPGVIPFPSEIVPPPVIPNISPRDVPRNPYPDRPECAEEWASAERYCKQLLDKKLLGRDGYRGMGKFFYQCVMGQVSARCGGNATGA
jgi:hypothetical protein